MRSSCDVLIESGGDGRDVLGELSFESRHRRLDALDALRRALHVGRLFHRPANPRAAVVARPSVPTLTVLRPNSAPSSVAPIDTAVCTF